MLIGILQMTTFLCPGQCSQIIQDHQREQGTFYCLVICKRKIQERQAHLSDEPATKPFVCVCELLADPRIGTIFPSLLFVCLTEK